MSDRSSSWTNSSDQIWTYVSDRTGILSVANLPILWLFAGRNDVFLWLTGWNFGTFNMFHRWVARVSTVEAIVHSIAYTYIYAKGISIVPIGRSSIYLFLVDGYLAEGYKEKFFYCGVVVSSPWF